MLGSVIDGTGDKSNDCEANDEQLRLAFGWGRELDKQSRWAITSEYVWLGDNKIDQTVQGERVKGDFDAYMIIVGVNYEHRF
jgi:opacity protein-like surface antigen